MRRLRWFTPTRVGTANRDVIAMSVTPVHPHASGDSERVHAQIALVHPHASGDSEPGCYCNVCDGSPPREWGQLH